MELFSSLLDPASKKGSRSAVVAWAVILTAVAFFLYILLGAPELGVMTGETLALSLSVAAGIGAFLGVCVATLPLRRPNIGWKQSHDLNGIARPLLAPFRTQLGAERLSKVTDDARTFVREVFFPLLRENAIREHITHLEEDFYSALTGYRICVVNRFVLGVSALAGIVGGAYLETVSVWSWSALTGILFVLNEKGISHSKSRISEVTRQEINALHDRHHQVVAGKVAAFFGVDLAISSRVPLVEASGVQRELTHTITSPGAVVYRVAEAILSAEEWVVVRYPNPLPPDWVFQLIPAILCSRERGVTIDVVARKDPSQREPGAFRLLRALGCDVRFDPLSDTPSDDLCCVLIDAGRRSADFVGLTSDGSAVRAFASDGAHVRNLVATLSELTIPAGRRERPRLPPLRTLPISVAEKRLRRVEDYAGRDCRIRVIPIDVMTTRPMSKVIRNTGLLQVEYLEKLYHKAGLAVFVPAVVAVADGMFSPVWPPVLESDGNGILRVHEGHSRMYAHWLRAKRGGPTAVNAIVVEGCPPPPRQRAPYAWEDVVPSHDLAWDMTYIHSHHLESVTRTMSRSQKEFDFITAAELEQ